MSLVTAPRLHAAAPVASASEPAAVERDFITTCLTLEPDGLVREAARAYGARLGGPAVTAADWAAFTDTWVEAMAYWDEPVERARLSEALAGVLDAVEPAGQAFGPRVGHLVERLFARWAMEPADPFERASALSAMLDLVDGVVRACGGEAIEPAALRGLLGAIDPPPQGLGPLDARGWMDDGELSHFIQAVASGVGGAGTSAAQRHELLEHVLAAWRPGEHLAVCLQQLVGALGGAQAPDAFRLAWLDRLLNDLTHGRQDLDRCLWLVGGDHPHYARNAAHVLRAAGPLLEAHGARLVRALAQTGQERQHAPQVLVGELARAADGWPRSLTVDMGCALAAAHGVAAMDEAEFAPWLEGHAPDDDAPGEPGSRQALILGLRVARDPLVLWEAPGLTPADRLALLPRIYGQPRLMSAPLARRCFERTLAADMTAAQRRELLLALFASARAYLPPEACSQARLVLSRDMAGLDASEREASIEAIASIMEAWVAWTQPLRVATDILPAIRNWPQETLAWHERVRLELAGPPGTLEHPEVAARLAPGLRDLMEQLAQALTRWERVPAAARAEIGALEAEEI